MGYIYLITNTINNKKYVGQTLREDINQRWKQHKAKKSIGRCLKAAYEKHGVENFLFQIICICFNEDCNKYEEEYIKKYNTISPNGYNLESGGKNNFTHPDTKKLISEKLKGRKLSEERIEKMKQGMRNYIITDIKRKEINMKISNKLKGKKLSEEEKNKRNKNTIISDEGKLKRNNALLIGVELNKKKVAKYDINNNFIENYNSVSEAALINNICIKNISVVCNNKKYCKTAGGFIWKFI